MQDLVREIISEIKGSWRYRYVAIVVAWAICISGWFAVYAYPDAYESSARVYVNTTSTLKPLLERMTVNTDVLSRVEMVSAAMLGTPRLREVAEETGLVDRLRTDYDMDDLIADMRRHVTVASDRGDSPNLYTISYRDGDPATAYAVVSRLLNIFVDESVGENRTDTENAQAFIRQELEKLGAELSAAESALAEFKRENVGRMPGASGDYFARLQSEMDSLERVEASLRRAVGRRDALRAQIAGESPTLDVATATQTELDVRIAENQSKLQDLQLRFTDQHPDVIAVRETIRQLKEQKRAEVEALIAGDGAGVASDNPVFQNIQIELTDVNVEIASLREEAATHRRKVRELRELVNVLPEVEAELARLTRDYDVKRAQYESLLERLQVAELSESAEQNQDVKFRVFDPPQLTDDPVQPNRPLLIIATMLAGLAAGGGLAFLLNRLNPVFSDIVALRRATELPILGPVQILSMTAYRRRRFLQLAMVILSIGTLCMIFGVTYVKHEEGSQYVQRVIAERLAKG